MRVLLYVFLIVTFSSHGVDLVKLHKTRSANDLRMPYKLEVLTAALEATVEKYGAYQIEQIALNRYAQRSIIDVQSAAEINLFVAVSQPEWENKAIPIRIPIKRGILNYRLLVIREGTQETFSQIKTLADLKKPIAALRKGWTTVGILKHHQLNVLEVSSLDGIFPMLSVGRVDYIPLGVNEIEDNISVRKAEISNLVIEEKLALYTKAPVYFFVSPKAPRIAQRLEEGMETLVKNGQLKAIFYRYFGEKIKRAALNKRTIIDIENPLMTQETPVERKELWFENDDEFQEMLPNINLNTQR